MQETETGKAGKEKDAKEVLEGRIKASKVFGVFGGIMKTCVDCLNCNNKSITTERYYDFNIVRNLDKGSRNVNVPTRCSKASTVSSQSTSSKAIISTFASTARSDQMLANDSSSIPSHK